MLAALLVDDSAVLCRPRRTAYGPERSTEGLPSRFTAGRPASARSMRRPQQEQDSGAFADLPPPAAVYFEQADYDKTIATAERAIEEGRERRADFKLIAKCVLPLPSLA